MMEKGPKHPTKPASAEKKVVRMKPDEENGGETIEQQKVENVDSSEGVSSKSAEWGGGGPPKINEGDLLVNMLKERTRSARDLFESRTRQEAKERQERADAEAIQETAQGLQHDAATVAEGGDNELAQKYIESAESLLGKLSFQDRKERAHHIANMLESEHISATLKREDAYHKANMLESIQNTAFLEKERGERIEAEAMPLLQELAAHNKEALADKELSAMVGKIGAARDRARADAIEDALPREEQKGILEKLHRVGEWHKNLPAWQKIAISSALLGVGAAGVALGGPAGIFASSLAYGGGRFLSGLGAFAASYSLLERQVEHRRVALGLSAGVGALWALAVPSVMNHMLQQFPIGSTLKGIGVPEKIINSWSDWHPFSKQTLGNPSTFQTSHESGWSDWHPLSKDMLGKPSGFTMPNTDGLTHAIEQIQNMNLFEKPIVVTEADRLHGLWGIIEKKLTEAHIIDPSTTPQKRNFMIDFLEKKLQRAVDLGEVNLEEIGFSSGKLKKIYAGEQLDLSILDKKGWIQQLR